MDLKYRYDSLEPYIDTKTVGLHYHNHYLTYVNNLNKILEEEKIKEDNLLFLLNNIDTIEIKNKDRLIFNIGGILNHELYFNSINPNKNIKPQGNLKIAIEKQFGNFENFKQTFINTALELVGSGYTFLVINSEKELQIINTSNQETPYLYGMIPIMAIDLWEHAYYLSYQSNKKQYIMNFFEIVDFDYVEKQYEQAI